MFKSTTFASAIEKNGCLKRKEFFEKNYIIINK